MTRPDPTSVAAVGTNWVESVCDSIAQKQRERFSAAARDHMALASVEKTIAKRIEKGKDAPAPCSLENALKGIRCKKGANARARVFEEKKVCLLSRFPEDRYTV